MTTTPPSDPWGQVPSGPPTKRRAGTQPPATSPGGAPVRTAAGSTPPPAAPDLTTPRADDLGWGGSQLPPPGGQLRVAREHGVADIIDFSFGMLRAGYKQIIGVVFLLGGPGLVLFGIGFTISQAFEGGSLDSVPVQWWWVLGIGGLLLVIGGIATEPAIIDIALTHSRGEQPSVMTSAWLGIRKVPGLAVVWTLLMVTAFLPVILVGLLTVAEGSLALLFILAVPITLGLVLVAVMVGHLVTATVVAESVGGWAGLGRVRGLLREQFWRTFGRGLLFGFMIQIIGGVAQFGSFVGLAFGEQGAIIVQVIAQLLQFLVLVPLTGMAALGLYADLRLRAEGVDELALL